MKVKTVIAAVYIPALITGLICMAIGLVEGLKFSAIALVVTVSFLVAMNTLLSAYYRIEMSKKASPSRSGDDEAG